MASVIRDRCGLLLNGIPGCRERSMLNVFYISTPSLGPPVSQLCLICSRGPWKCETAPPGRAVLTARWFCAACSPLRCQTRRQAYVEGGEGKKMHRRPLLLHLLAPRPHTVSLEGQFTLKSLFFYCIFCRTPPPQNRNSSTSAHARAFKGRPPAAL